jgi:hypothetical protein
MPAPIIAQILVAIAGVQVDGPCRSQSRAAAHAPGGSIA